jgi:hypothetical protein
MIASSKFSGRECAELPALKHRRTRFLSRLPLHFRAPNLTVRNAVFAQVLVQRGKLLLTRELLAQLDTERLGVRGATLISLAISWG